MSKNVNLEEIERQAFLSYHQDGLLDIMLGIILIPLGIIMLIFPEFWPFVIGGFIVMVIPLYTTAKRSITVPRIGYVEFSQERQHKSTIILIVLMLVIVIANVLTIVAWLNPSFGLLLEANFLIIVAVIAFVVFVLIANVTSLRRFYVYGILMALAFLFSNFWKYGYAFPLIGVGLVSLAVGGILLIRFLHEYPKNEGGQGPDG